MEKVDELRETEIIYKKETGDGDVQHCRKTRGHLQNNSQTNQVIFRITAKLIMSSSE